jgi:hypothetical protein
MKPKLVSIPELGMIAGTRVALGAGIGLLLAERLNNDQRRAVGWTLLAVGALSTIPLAAEVMLDHDHRGDRDGRNAPREISSRARRPEPVASAAPRAR